MANIFISKLCDRQSVENNHQGSVTDVGLQLQDKIWQIIIQDTEVDGGITQLSTGDFVLRILGHRAQKLQQIADAVKQQYCLTF